MNNEYNIINRSFKNNPNYKNIIKIYKLIILKIINYKYNNDKT
jgi:hypothetical protein